MYLFQKVAKSIINYFLSIKQKLKELHIKKELLTNLESQFEKNDKFHKSKSKSQTPEMNPNRDIKALRDKLKNEKENLYYNKELCESTNVKIKHQQEYIEKLEEKLNGIKLQIETANDKSKINKNVKLIFK